MLILQALLLFFQVIVHTNIIIRILIEVYSILDLYHIFYHLINAYIVDIPKSFFIDTPLNFIPMKFTFDLIL